MKITEFVKFENLLLMLPGKKEAKFDRKLIQILTVDLLFFLILFKVKLYEKLH